MKIISGILLGLSLFLFSTIRAAAADDPKQTPEIADAQKAAEKVCMTLKPFLERADKLKSIKVEKNDEINAFADMKNNVTIFMGMIDFTRDENELAVVCAHEMAHVSGQHIKRSIFTSVVSTIASEVIGGTPGDIAGAALANKQSRKHEREADSRGLLYMWEAGFDPRSAWKFWESLQQKYKQGNSVVDKYFGTHPVNDERVINFKVLLVRYCKEKPTLNYCDEIMADKDLLDTFNKFEEN
jgi:predicted Zn-dependent protease